MNTLRPARTNLLRVKLSEARSKSGADWQVEKSERFEPDAFILPYLPWADRVSPPSHKYTSRTFPARTPSPRAVCSGNPCCSVSPTTMIKREIFLRVASVDLALYCRVSDPDPYRIRIQRVVGSESAIWLQIRIWIQVHQKELILFNQKILKTSFSTLVTQKKIFLQFEIVKM